MAYKQITPCVGGSAIDADFGVISVTNGDILYLTFTNSSANGCYTVDSDVFTYSETVVTTTPSYIDCASCLATPVCECNLFSVTIGSTDVNDATGNTGGYTQYNGVVVWSHLDCDSGLNVEYLLGAGTYNYCACGLSNQFTYWKDNAQYVATASNGNAIGPCGISPTPASTPSSTPASTPNSTPASTPNSTPASTPSVTSTPTQTQTTTPSASGIICGLGFTTGTYYYTDCCGDLIQGSIQNLTVSMDYTKPSSGVNKLNSFATQACPSPTPTQTQTYTPTNTITPSVTPSVTKTPTVTPSTTVTPSKSGVFRLKNNCDVFTLFDLGVSCNVITNPSSPTSNDGILSLNVTGGTSPYSFYWTNGQRTQTLAQIGQGVYECTVIDYYGDYSSTTVCSLFAPSATPTPSVTTTPTVTPSGTCPKLCFIAIGTNTSYGPWQFVCNGMFNGKTTWNYGEYNIVWKGARWEIVGSDMTTPFVAVNGGIFASNSTSSIPSNGWASVGGVYEFSVTMTEGNCPSTIPLQTKVTSENSTCDGIKNCDGTITISASYGTPPYQYSINNGLTYQSNGLFFELCPNTYTIITRDSLNNSVNNSVTIGYNQAPTNYQLSVKQLANATVVVSGPNFNTTTTYLEIITNPPLPTGITLEFDLNFTSVKTTNGPGFGTINDNISVSQNGNLISPTTQQTPVTQINSRPNCSPETQEVKTETESYGCVLSKTSTVTFITQSVLEITNGQISQNSCVTNLIQTIYAGISSQVIKGCTCCTAIAGDSVDTINNSVSYVSGAVNPLPTCVPKAYYISNGGTFYWTDCNGIDRRDVFDTGDEICICSSNNLPTSQNGGTGYLLGGGCDCVTSTPT